MKSKRFLFFMKEYLTFTVRERNGILILFSLILIVTCIRFTLHFILPEPSPIDIQAYRNEISQFELSRIRTDSTHVKQKSGSFIARVEQRRRPQPVVTAIEINTADSVSLLKLPGIGPVFSHRILQYRSLLGGYCNISQLGEIYGFKPETIHKIRNKIQVDSSRLNKIPVNTASFQRILRHPYITYEQTRGIMYLRKYHPITAAEQLSEAHIFNDEQLKKVAPYLSFY